MHVLRNITKLQIINPLRMFPITPKVLNLYEIKGLFM